MQKNTSEIKELIWIDKSVFNDENQGYKKVMEESYGLKVHEYDNAEEGIEAIKKTEIYSPIFIITSGSIYPEFLRFFKSAVTYIKNLPVQIIFTSDANSFLIEHEKDEIGKQIGKFYNLGGVTDDFSQVENFIIKMNQKLKDYKVKCLYTYKRSQNFSGLQTFTYLSERKTLFLPRFYKNVLEDSKIDYNEILEFIHFMLNNFANEKICDLFKGMILFNDIPEPILSKFFARAYTLESPFYGIMNQNLMKGNYKYYSTYIKLLYKGILNNSYPPKTDCTLYRGTKLERFEINYLKDILKRKNLWNQLPIIYATSFLSFSTNYAVSKQLAHRRIIIPTNEDKLIKVEEPSKEEEKSSSKDNKQSKKANEKPIKLIANSIKLKKPEIKAKKQIELISPKIKNKPIQKNKPLAKVSELTKKKSKSKQKYKPVAKVIQPNKKENKPIEKENHLVKADEQNITENIISNESSSSSNSNTVYLKLNPLKEEDKDKILLTNGFLKQISYFHGEDEVLFFPFSSFELVDIYEEGSTTFIVLDYSPRFITKIENCIFSVQ